MGRLVGWWFVLTSASCVLLAACEGPESKADGVTGSEPRRTVETFVPRGNGSAVSEEEGCKRLREALDQAAKRMACVYRPMQCPALIRSSGGAPCSQYDTGTVEACVGYYSKFTTCDDLIRKRCVVKPLPGTAPDHCPEDDAGVEDAGDEGGLDAATEDVTDAPTDSSSDVLDAAEDADAADGGLDSGPDAATDASGQDSSSS